MAVTRRNFMFGAVASAAGAALILRPNDADALKLFEPTLDEVVSISRGERLPTEYEWGVGHVLYAEDGMPVMHVRSWSINAPVDGMLEVTALGDTHREFVPGRMRRASSIEVSGYPIRYPRIGG